MKKQSYKKYVTEDVKPYKAYENDFTNQGVFSEEVELSPFRTNLTHTFTLYRRQEETWVGAKNYSYFVHIRYYSKHYVRIIFDARSCNDPDLQETFEFMQNVAKKFYLVTRAIGKIEDGIVRQELLLPMDAAWGEVDAMIKVNLSLGFISPWDALSFEKTMTMQEAKQLFEFIGLAVGFPS